MSVSPSKFSEQDLLFLSQFCTKNHLSPQFLKRSSFSLQPVDGQIKLQKSVSFLVSYPQDASEEESKTLLEEMKRSSPFFASFGFTKEISVGDLAKPLPSMPFVYGDDEKFPITVYPKVSLIYIWKASSNNHVERMEKIHEISKKYGQNFKAISISKDPSKDIPINALYDHEGWEAMDHYFLDKTCEASETYRILFSDKTPYFWLFDKEKILRMAGDPNEVDYELLVETLIRGEKIVDEAKIEEKIIPKKLCNLLISLFSEEKYERVCRKLELSWSKEQTYDLSGRLVSSIYGKPSFKMSYNIIYDVIAKELREKLLSHFPKGENTFNNFSIDEKDKLKTLKPSVKELKALLKKNNLEEVNVAFRTEEIYSYSSSFSKNRNQFLYQRSVPSSAKYENFKTFSDELDQLKEKESQLENFSFRTRPNSFDAVEPILVEDVLTNKTFLLAPEKGWNYVILRWENGNTPDNYEWTLKIVNCYIEVWKSNTFFYFVSLSNESSKKKFQEFSQAVNNPHFRYLMPKTKDEGKVNYHFPHDINLVDNGGNLYYLEHQGNSFRNGGTFFELVDIKYSAEKFSREDYKKATRFLRNEKNANSLTELLKSLGYNCYLDINVFKDSSFDEKANAKPVEYVTPRLFIGMRKNDYESRLLPLLKDFPIEKFHVIPRLLETVTIKMGSECHNCKKELKQFEPQYHCYACQIWFCEACADIIDNTKQGNASLIHPHNLIWIDVKDEQGMAAIEKYRLGTNRFYKTNIQKMSYSCSGCNCTIYEKFRYICISCKPGILSSVGYIELCENCFRMFKKRDPNDSNCMKIADNLKAEKHEDNHLFLRVCFGDHYYMF